MKKYAAIFTALLLALIAVLLFWVFSSRSQEKAQPVPTPSHSQRTSSSKSSSKQTNSVSSSESETASSQAESSSSSQTASQSEEKKSKQESKKEQEAVSALDMQAIAGGDYSTMAGTWQDAAGSSYSFDASGITTDLVELETGAPYSGLDESGIYRAGIRWNHGPGAAFIIIPAGTPLPARETYDGTDPTDISQDRFIIAQGISEHPDVYYRVK